MYVHTAIMQSMRGALATRLQLNVRAPQEMPSCPVRLLANRCAVIIYNDFIIFCTVSTVRELWFCLLNPDAKRKS